MITVKQVINILNNALREDQEHERLCLADRRFLSCFDEATTYSYLANALNGVLLGNPLFKYNIPSLVKRIFIVCRQFNDYIQVKGVSLGNVVHFIINSVYNSGIIVIHDDEASLLREMIDSSVYLLLTDVPIYKRGWVCSLSII